MPFISAGGTSLSVFMEAIGILCNVEKVIESSEELKIMNFDIKLFNLKRERKQILYF